jgi:hypothetical protein
LRRLKRVPLGADGMNFEKITPGCWAGCLTRDVACTGDVRAVSVTVREPCLAVSARSCSLAEC